MAAIGWIIVVPLMLLALRRLALVVASCLPPPRNPAATTPSVLVAVPACNEAERLPRLLGALEELDYPPENLSIVLINDGSSDRTPLLMHEWAASRPGVLVLDLAGNAGKAEALNQGLAACPGTELLAVYDADLNPAPDALRALVAPFADQKVGAVSGYRLPENARRNRVTRYAALEAWVHQLVIQAGKDRIGLNPATMGGNCIYRRRALEQVGAFPSGSFSEDTETSLALTALGWRTRFTESAVAAGSVAATLHEYWNQRARWMYGMYHAARHARGLESLVVAAGYADRLLLLLSLLGAMMGYLSWWWPLAYVLAAASCTLAGLLHARAGRAMPEFILSLAAMLPVEFAWAAAGTWRAVMRQPSPWRGDRSAVL